MSQQSYKYGKIVGWASIIGNSLLFVLKYYAGIVTGSIALLADAWHTLSDSVSSVILLVGIKWSKKPADDDHPFGHGRVELISSIIIGFILGVIALKFGWEGIERLTSRESVEYGWIAIWITVFSIAVKEAMAQFNFYFYRKTKMLSIKADGWHHRSDAVSSVIILVGIFVGNYVWWVDGVLAIIVAVLIGYTGYAIVVEGINPLLGEEPSSETRLKIQDISNHVAGFDTFVHHIHIHRYGMHTEVTFHVRLPIEHTFEEVERLTLAIEKALKNELDMHATVRPQVYYADTFEK
jgi:cation diffusion facilitator family transporter